MQSLLFGIKNLFITVIATVTDYDLLVIEDEETPLAPGVAGPDYFGMTMFTMVLVLALCLFAAWCVKRNAYKARLVELRIQLGDESEVVPFSIRMIKDEIAKSEAEITSTYI